MSRPMRPDSGNMLIYILGAIVLIGLLIVAMKGSFQEGTGIDAEKTALKVNEVQRFAAELERGVAYILRDGYSENDIRFAHPTGAAAYAAYGSISNNPKRQVFSPQGGGVEWRDPPAGIRNPAGTHLWYFTGDHEITSIGSTCSTQPQCLDLVLYLTFVTKDFCLRVNDANGITNPSGDAPTAPSLPAITSFTGFDALNNATLSPTGGYLDGKMEGCIKISTYYHYYRVLLAR